MDETETTVRQFIVKNFLFDNEANAPQPETSFLEVRLLDSTGILELVHFLESTFAITIADNELTPDNLDSLRKISSFIARKRGV
jgi:acyl carrier protein